MKTNNYTLLFSFVFVIVVLPEIGLSQISELHYGEKIRVHIAHWEANGRIVRLTDKYLTISTKNSVQNIPFNYITELEIAHGTKSNWNHGLLLGSIFGVVTGGTLALATYEKDTWFTLGETIGIGAVGFGVMGGLLGLVVGAGTRTTRWKRIRLNPTLTRLPTDFYHYSYHPGITFQFNFPSEP